VSNTDPDKQLYREIQQRKPEALALLLERHGPALVRFIHGYLAHIAPAEVEEVLNDTLYAVWSDIARYDPRRARFKTWVFLQARSLALDRRRKLARQAPGVGAGAPEAAELLADALLRLDLVLALSELSAADRLLYYLCEWQGYDREQVAVRIGVRRGTLNARLRRIRERLRRVLRAGGWGPAVAEVGHE